MNWPEASLLPLETALLRSVPSLLLLRVSARFCVEDVGVAWAEPEGECVPASGEAVPELGSLPFFFDNLLRSVALESCSC